MKITPVILSGGSGTRLWPLSRHDFPKQFLSLTEEQSLYQKTLARVKDKAIFNPSIVIANDSHRFTALEQADNQNSALKALILEPIGRNTAAAIAIAALKVAQSEPKGLFLVLPSDHLIKNETAFLNMITKANEIVKDGYHVCFSITPHFAETGYGYIQQGKALDMHAGAYHLKEFKEKPSKSIAEKYVNSGDYSWNSGMFMFRADVIIDDLEKFAPEILAKSREALKGAQNDLAFERLDSEAFCQCPSLSIDYAIMEHTDHAVVIPVDIGWSDLGSFSALADILQPDKNGNVSVGDAYHIDSQNTMVHSHEKLVGLVGVDNLDVIVTADAVLVAARDKSDDVKTLFKLMQADKRPELTEHKTVYRPWGQYTSIGLGPRFQAKEIIVKPGKKLSLQSHHHRAEHWIVVEGTALVTKGSEKFLLEENQSTYISIGETHRLENPGKVPLKIIEVQSGAYLGEDDIVRYEDDFGRDD